MPQWLTEWFATDPNFSYVAVATLFILCGLGPIQQLDLTPAGFAGCTLYPQAFASAVLGLVDPTGSAPTFNFPIPNNPALTYAKLNCQGATIGANGVELSDVVLALLGG